MNNKYLQVSFLPWADIKTKIQIGNITFFPFSKIKKKIKDSVIKKHLRKYFHCYIDHNGKAVDTVTLCYFGDDIFKALNDEEYSELRNAVNVLIFCTVAPSVKNAVCANNRSMGPPSSDKFQLITQNFTPENDYIAVRAGSLLSGGLEMRKVKFPKPFSIGGAFGMRDNELINGFNRLYENNYLSEDQERILRSLEWFRLSHIENEDVSYLSKIVMMATAFEILLQVPMEVKGKKKWIATKLEEQAIRSRLSKQTKKDNKGGKHRHSKLFWWAWDFYNLRNVIVHGDHIDLKKFRHSVKNKKWISHHIVADLIFLECIKREFFKWKCIGDDVRTVAKKWDETFPRKNGESTEEELAEWWIEFRRVYKALRWMKQIKKKSS